jgi:hypothetical protein
MSPKLFLCMRANRQVLKMTFPDYYEIARTESVETELPVYQEPDILSRPLGNITYNMMVEGLSVQRQWMQVCHSVYIQLTTMHVALFCMNVLLVKPCNFCMSVLHVTLICMSVLSCDTIMRHSPNPIPN